MGDTEVIKRPWMKEFREWLNLIFTFLAVCGVPVLTLVIRNTKLEIMRDIADKYVSQSLYDKDALRQQQDRGQMQTTVGVIQGKVESIQLEQIHEGDRLTMIQEQLANRKAP